MGTSGNPAKKAAAKQASTASEFKKRKQGTPLILPSGLTIIARRVDLTTFVSQGDIPNPLLPIVQDALAKGQSADMGEIMGTADGGVNMTLITEMLNMINNVVVSVSVDPKIHPTHFLEGEEVPAEYKVGDMIPEDLRDDEVVYADDLDEEDKMFVFQWTIGGTDDVATFRAEAEEGLVTLAKGQVSGSTA